MSDDLQLAAAALLERMEKGELEEDRLKLAAYLGDPATLLAYQMEGPVELVGLEELRRWIDGLRLWGREVQARAAVAAARWVVSRSQKQGQEVGPALHALEAAEAFLLNGDPSQDAAVNDAGYAADGAGPAGDLAQRLVFESAAHAAWSIAGPWEPGVAATAVCNAARAGDPDSPDIGGALGVVQRELVPWAVGHRDPLAEHVRQMAGRSEGA